MALIGGAAGGAYWAGRRRGNPATVATPDESNVVATVNVNATQSAVATPKAPSVGRPSASGFSFGESDAEDASRKAREDAERKAREADKLVAKALTAFKLGGEAHVEKAIKLISELLELVDLAANRDDWKTFKEKLEALRKTRAEKERKAKEAKEQTEADYRRGCEPAFGLNGTEIDGRHGGELLKKAADAGSGGA